MRAFIILAIVGATAGAGYYFGHMRNEEVCYEEIKKEITRTQETLDLWKAKPPANSSITSMDEYRGLDILTDVCVEGLIAEPAH